MNRQDTKARREEIFTTETRRTQRIQKYQRFFLFVGPAFLPVIPAGLPKIFAAQQEFDG
jgi:hypothetical protein